MIRRTARHAVAASTLAVLALGVSACGGTDVGTTADTPQETVTVTESPMTDDTDDTGEDQAGNGNAGNSGGNNGGNSGGDALTTAVRTATGAVDGTVVGIDQQRNGWEIDVVAGDGSETRVDVSADGSQVQGQRPDDQDGDDRAENQQLLGAQVDWVAALKTARAELGNDVDELDLGEDDGRITWEASLPGDGPGTSVIIDASSGQVIGTDD